MPKSIISEGKTTTEAISNGLKKLNVSKDKVDIKVIEEHEKRSFFSILAPRIVKVELTLKEEKNSNSLHEEHKQREVKITKEELEECKIKIENFLKDFVNQIGGLDYKINIEPESGFIKIDMDGENSKFLIGYRGEVLNSLQIILGSIANKHSKDRAKVILNISNYKEKREKSLEELADKISKTVLKTGKTITLEPMMAYERKIIHNRLQSNNRVVTYSVGEEPYRKVVIAKNNNII